MTGAPATAGASRSPLVALTIAGTDSGGGAGVAADLATFADHGLHGTAVVTAVTAQDTTAVHAIHPVPLDVVAAQLDAVLADLPPAAVKTGMLGSADVARLVADRLAAARAHLPPLVVDPVLRATTGAVLAAHDGALAELVKAYRADLLPLATVVTPNAAEARVLLEVTADDPMPDAALATALAALLAGPAVVLTGGPTGPLRDVAEKCHIPERPAAAPHAPAAAAAAAGSCVDWVAVPGQEPVALAHPAIDTANDHGTGCTFASALAARLARGDDLPAAARAAAAYTTRQLTLSHHWTLGRGRGPVAHLTKEMSA